MMRLACLIAVPTLLAAQTPEELFQQRKLPDARAAFQAQLAKDKNDANALYHLGRIAALEGKRGEAVDWLEKAVKRNDTSATYHYWLGSALGDEAQNANKLRQPFLARRVKSEFERAVQLDPKMLEPRAGLVDFYSIAPGIMGGSMDKAKEQAVEIGKMNPMRGHWSLARILTRQKDMAGAEREYRAAIAAAPDSSVGYSFLGQLLRSQGRWDEAFETYEQHMKARPDDPAPHANWGVTAAGSGKNLERGERELKYWLEHRPPAAPTVVQSGIHFQLGRIYEQQGKKELAKESFAESLKLNPQNQDAKKALAALK